MAQKAERRLFQALGENWIGEKKISGKTNRRKKIMVTG